MFMPASHGLGLLVALKVVNAHTHPIDVTGNALFIHMDVDSLQDDTLIKKCQIH